mmetsp:Transcript_8294/g.36683  ORF Transcript_8294/g.36683 Transcript_8294/m.36683 type:complete len:232 (+) Transcript_8294:611-1306(+)
MSSPWTSMPSLGRRRWRCSRLSAPGSWCSRPRRMKGACSRRTRRRRRQSPSPRRRKGPPHPRGRAWTLRPRRRTPARLPSGTPRGEHPRAAAAWSASSSRWASTRRRRQRLSRRLATTRWNASTGSWSTARDVGERRDVVLHASVRPCNESICCYASSLRFFRAPTCQAALSPWRSSRASHRRLPASRRSASPTLSICSLCNRSTSASAGQSTSGTPRRSSTRCWRRTATR